MRARPGHDAHLLPRHLQSIISKHVSKAIAGAVEGATTEAIAAYQSFVVGSLGDGAPRRGPGRPPRSAKVTPTAKPAKPKPKSRGRRSSSQITATLDRVLTYLGKHPGQRSEQIQKGLGGAKKAISDALERLRAAKKVTTKGVKRSMTYSV